MRSVFASWLTLLLLAAVTFPVLAELNGRIVSPDGALEGVVVYKQLVRVYYPFGQAVAKKPPTCASLDMVKPSADIAEPQDAGKRPDSGQRTAGVKKKGDKLKFHWRSASMDYGKKFRLDFRLVG